MEPDKYKGVEFYKAKSCSRCRNTGYFGRTALIEILEMRMPIRKTIFEDKNQDDIRLEALNSGMITLRESGIRKAVAGKVSLEVVLKNTIEED